MDRIKVTISFCHDKDNSLRTEGVSKARYERGYIYYYLEDLKTRKLKEIHKEPYKENSLKIARS